MVTEERITSADTPVHIDKDTVSEALKSLKKLAEKYVRPVRITLNPRTLSMISEDERIHKLVGSCVTNGLIFNAFDIFVCKYELFKDRIVVIEFSDGSVQVLSI